MDPLGFTWIRQIGLEEIVDLGQAFEPFDQADAHPAVVEPMIPLVAKVAWQARYYYEFRHNFSFLLFIVRRGVGQMLSM